MLKNPSTRLLEAGTRGLLSDQAMSGVSATSWACHILDRRCRITGQQAASNGLGHNLGLTCLIVTDASNRPPQVSSL